MKIAVTFRAPLIVTVHIASDTESQPVQPVKFESAPAAAVSVTCEPPTNDAEHVGAHAMPVGFDVTVPLPSPWRITDRFCNVTTLTVVLPVFARLSVIVIVAVPGATAVTSPVELTVATL